MLHVSTRGEAPAIGFTDAMLTGLARDGGLYVPETWPTLTRGAIQSFAGQRYADVAKAVLAPLMDDIPSADLDRMVEGAYASFRHAAVCPLTQLGDNLFVLELFHGPTLAFKDVAKAVLAPLMEEIPRASLDRMIEEAYATFRHAAVCPLTQLCDNLFVLERRARPERDGRCDPVRLAATGRDP